VSNTKTYINIHVQESGFRWSRILLAPNKNTTSISLIKKISYEIPEQMGVKLTTSHHRHVPKASRVVDVSIVVAAVAFSKTWQIYCSLDIVLEHFGFLCFA